MAGKLRRAQQLRQGQGAAVGGQRHPVRHRQGSGGGEPVEQGGVAARSQYLTGVGKLHVDHGGDRAGLCGGLLCGEQRGLLRLGLPVFDHVGDHGGGAAPGRVVGFTGRGVRSGVHGGHVGGVAFAASGQPDVGGLGAAAGRDDGVAGVDGHPLGGVHGGGVAEHQVGLDVAGR